MADTRIDDLLPRLSECLARQTGLYFPEQRWPDLARGIGAVARELGAADTAACIRHLLSTPLTRHQIEILARHLTVGETYFFRDPALFEVLQNHILPGLIRARRASGMRLRLWSAGCATGEEAYTLAVLVQRLIPDFRQWNIEILGTDINPRALEIACGGVYGEWSFRNAPRWLREQYFSAAAGGRYEIAPAVREMVTFAYLNLAEDAYPSLTNNTNAMDVIFCRNVLMYFEPRLAADVVRKHHQALVDGGWLIVSPSEISEGAFAMFEAVHFPNAILHQKAAAANLPGRTERRRPETAVPLPATEGTAAIAAAAPPVAAAHGSPSGGEKRRPATYEAAYALYLQGRYSEATAETEKLLAAGATSCAMTLMAKIHANRGELPAALRWSERTIASDRLNPVGHYLRAAILQEQGRLEEAMLSYKRTLYLDQDFVLAHFALGHLFRRQRKLRESDKHFENALQLLGRRVQDEVLPEADGMTAGRLTEIIRNGLFQREHAA